MRQTELTEQEFDARYTLVPNHFNEEAPWSFDDGPGHQFETYGEELAFIQAQNPHAVWTLVAGEGGGEVLISGYHVANRIGYLVTKEAVPNGTVILVKLG